MRILSICALALLCLLPAQAGSPKTAEEAQAILDKTNRLFGNPESLGGSELHAVIKDMQLIRDSDAFVRLPSRMQYWTLRFQFSAAYHVGENAIGKAAVDEACTFAEAGRYDWTIRFFLDRRLENYRDAAVSIIKLAKQWPEGLKDIADSAFGSTARQLDDLPDGKALKLSLLQALYDAKWRPSEFAPDYADFNWQDLAALQLDAGQIAPAKDIADAIVNPKVVKSMLSQKRFDALTGHFNLDKAWDAAIVSARAWMAANPDKLEAVLYLAQRLYDTDRQTEALALIEAAFKRIDDNSQKPYTDLKNYLNWLHDAHARVLFALGRDDEAFAALELGAGLQEYGSSNVSQIINLALAYGRYGRPQDALKVLARLDIDKKGASSDYGRMAYVLAKIIALIQTGDSEALAEARRYIEAHADDAPDVAVEALLVLGDLDAAAKLAISQLGDSLKQSEMLGSLQPNAVPKLAILSPQQRLLRERYKALRERLDVKKAIDSIGRILDIKTL